MEDINVKFIGQGWAYEAQNGYFGSFASEEEAHRAGTAYMEWRKATALMVPHRAQQPGAAGPSIWNTPPVPHLGLPENPATSLLDRLNDEEREALDRWSDDQSQLVPAGYAINLMAWPGWQAAIKRRIGAPAQA